MRCCGGEAERERQLLVESQNVGGTLIKRIKAVTTWRGESRET